MTTTDTTRNFLREKAAEQGLPDDPESWRGVGNEDQDDVPANVSVILRDRSRRLLKDLLRPHKKTLGWLTAIVLVENGARLAIPYLVGAGIDDGIRPILNGGSASTLFVIVGLIALLAVFQAGARQIFIYWSGKLGQRILLTLRRRVFSHFQKLSMKFHEKYTSGRVVSRLTSDVHAIQELLQNGFEGLITAVLTLVGTAVFLLILDVRLALTAIAAFPILLLLTGWFRKQSSIVYRRTRETVALVIIYFVESITGMRAVQAFRREPRNQQIFEKVNDDYAAANEQSMKLIALFMPGIKLIGNVTIGIVLIYGGWLAYHGEVTVGVLASFMLYLRQFFEPLQEISGFYNMFQQSNAALEKLSGVLEEESDVPEPKEPVKLEHPQGKVRFEKVGFSYVDGDPVLPELDLKVPAGQTIALVGATGAGKTTLAKLLSRFYDPTTGQVLLDGVDLRDLDEATLRRAVVMVTQENFLFTGTVADNIRFGRPHATDAEVVAAARAIGAHEFISALPQGYDTNVAKRGGRLSAGQRQLVAFARAFLADPAVLILDEATSSLDVPSERLVQRALRTILAERTSLIIAHRLSTVEIADRVLVMEQGRIVEDGPPSELIAGTGRFADLHQAWMDSLT